MRPTYSDCKDEIAMALWQDVQASRLIYEYNPCPLTLAQFYANYRAFCDAFAGKRVLQ